VSKKDDAMPDNLRRLLKSHDFLENALTTYGKSMTAMDAVRLQQEKDHVFLELLAHASTDPRITLAQINFFVATLASLAKHPSDA